ncbi:hypothetical protein EON65_20625 [archaeon]|nr:MAG: hypothetical protein EON65_20625 [archaeon]
MLWIKFFLTLVIATQSFYSFICQTIKGRDMYITSNIGALSNEADKGKQSLSFDVDFAEAISKPLPKWYEEANAKQERFIKKLEKNHEEIVDEFGKRYEYEITGEEKRNEHEKKWARIQQRVEGKKNKKDLWSKVTRLFNNKKEEDTTVSQSVVTKGNWEKSWEKEGKQTGFYLPGLFEVFPELQFKWPVWTRRKDGSAVECESDKDCLVPQACYSHPILPGQKYCCTGWTQRVMVPKYVKAKMKTIREAPKPGGYGTDGY